MTEGYVYTTYECLDCPNQPEAPIAQVQTGASKGTMGVTSSKQFADQHRTATGHKIKTIPWEEVA